MNRQFLTYVACMIVSLAPLGWQTVRSRQVAADRITTAAVVPAPPLAAGGLELAGPELAGVVHCGLLATEEGPKTVAGGSSQGAALSVWQPMWQAWARSRLVLLGLKNCDHVPTLAAGVHVLDDCRQRLEKSTGDETLLLAAIDSELALWKTVGEADALATAAQEALAAKDYRRCLELCRDHDVKVAPFLNGLEAARFANARHKVNLLVQEALLDVDYHSIPAGSPEQKIAALDRFLVLYSKDAPPQGANVIKQASLELEMLQSSQAVRQFVSAPPQDLARRIQAAAELYNRFPEPEVHAALSTAAKSWLTEFLSDRSIPNCPGILESVSRTNGHIVLGCYEPQSGAEGIFFYWPDPAQKSAQPIRIDLAHLDGPPRTPWFVRAAQVFNEQAAKVRNDPASATAWSELAACCQQLEQQSAGYRARAAQAGSVRPVEDASFYAGLSFQLVAEQSQIVVENMESVRTLFEQRPVLQEARR